MWTAADILRGSLDPADYRQPIMTLLFIKRLNDTFEENAEKLIKEGKSEKEAYENRNRHSFFIPKEARWSVLSKTSENIGGNSSISLVLLNNNADSKSLGGTII